MILSAVGVPWNRSKFVLSIIIFHALMLQITSIYSDTAFYIRLNLSIKLSGLTSDDIIFHRVAWSGDTEMAFRSSSQAASCQPQTVDASHYPF